MQSAGNFWGLDCLQSTMDALMELKTAMGSGNAWAWSPASSYCGWFGISCSSDNQLTGLDLSNAGLDGQMPDSDSLLAMSKLQSLDLSGNDLTVRTPQKASLQNASPAFKSNAQLQCLSMKRNLCSNDLTVCSPQEFSSTLPHPY